MVAVGGCGLRLERGRRDRGIGERSVEGALASGQADCGEEEEGAEGTADDNRFGHEWIIGASVVFGSGHHCLLSSHRLIAGVRRNIRSHWSMEDCLSTRI